MKTSVKVFLMVLLPVALFVQARYAGDSGVKNAGKQTAIGTPDNVKAVIDNKCYMCHSTKGRSQEARDHLMWDSIPLYPKAKLIAKLDDIIDVLDDGKMPPKKMVEMNPDAALSPEELLALRNWAQAASDSLLK
jgi:hypothetical protein